MSEPLPTPWVDLRQVTVRYGRVQALDQVTLRIAPGERVALVGANGSGKSTLLRVLHGLADTHGGGLQCDASRARPCCSSALTCCAPVPRTMWPWPCGCAAPVGAMRARWP